MRVVLPKNKEFDLDKHSIIVGLSGSKAYGTNHPLSDTDWKGVLVPPRRFYMSGIFNFEQTSWKSEQKSGRVSEQDGVPEADEEGTIFGIDKFINLATACNPNVIELLFLNENQYEILTEEGIKLIDNRSLFLSEKALYTFTGYAMSQLKRIRTHKSWIDNPPSHKPEREEFGLPDVKLIHRDQMEAAQKIINRHITFIAPWLLDVGNEQKEAFYESLYGILNILAEKVGISLEEKKSWIEIEDMAKDISSIHLGFDDNFMEYLRKEKSYTQSYTRYKQYQSWLKNRNPARAELETRYGYDCKHAMHLVRLLRMGGEILTTGTMSVYRPDREELLEIRNGSWEYERLVEWGESKVEELNNIVKDRKSAVPKKPDIHKIAELNIQIKDMFEQRNK